MSGQYIVQYIHDYDDRIQTEEVEHTATFRMSDRFFSDTLTASFFAYAGIDPDDPADSDALLRPSLSYSIEDGVELNTGAEVFVGSAGKFGQYSRNTMGYVALRWYF